MRFLFDKCLRLDSRELETDTFACINSQIQVLLSLINVHILLGIDCLRENGIFNSNINKLSEDDTCFKAMEQVIILRVNRDEFFAVLVSIEELVDQLSKANSFFNEIGVSESTFSDTLRYLTIIFKDILLLTRP
jgi:hypothetical protein